MLLGGTEMHESDLWVPAGSQREEQTADVLARHVGGLMIRVRNLRWVVMGR